MRALRIVPFLIAPAFVGCDCHPIVTGIAPQIYLDACKSPDKVVGTGANAQHIGGFQDCGIDFGARDISVKVTQTVKVTNPSTIELHIDDIFVIGDPSFEVVTKDFKGNKVGLGKGDAIGPGLSGTIVVSVRPNTATTIKTTLNVKSDAKNTPQTPDHQSLVQIPITATGVDNGVPQIVVSPTECNYDRVPVSGVKVCTVTISNTGTRALVLDSVEFVPPSNNPNDPVFQVPTGSDPAKAPFAFAGRPPSPDEEIAPTDPNASPPVLPVTLQVQFRPDVLGTYLGQFDIASNDPNHPDPIEVTLQGTAVTPPNCVAKIKSVNGEAVGGSVPQIAPLDDVVLSLEDSTASTPNGSIGGYSWSIAQQPSVSHAQLATPSNVDTGLTFDSDGIHQGVDFAGDYKICGEVGDDLGVNSVNECCVAFTAIPKEGFHVELSWDTTHNDIDLHVTKRDGSGQFCAGDTSGSVTGPEASDCGDTNDCNWSNCKANESFNTPPEWDGVPGRTDGDPSLDVDDLDGFGPENININTPVAGDYLVSVEGFTLGFEGDPPDPSSDVQVNVFIFGQLAGSFTAKLVDNQWWEAAIVHWPADTTAQLPCVEDLTDGNAHDQCG